MDKRCDLLSGLVQRQRHGPSSGVAAGAGAGACVQAPGGRRQRRRAGDERTAGGDKALTPVRRHGPPSSLAAEFNPTRAGSYKRVWSRGGKTIACRKIAVAAKAHGAVDRAGPERLAAAPPGTAQRELLLGLDRGAVRRARRAVARLPAAAPALRDPRAQLPPRSPRPARGHPKNKARSRRARLRRPALLPARLFRVEDRACRSASATASAGRERGRPAAAIFYTNETRRRRGKDALAGVQAFLRQLANRVHSGSARTGARGRHRLLSGGARRARRCARAPCTPIRTAT